LGREIFSECLKFWKKKIKVSRRHLGNISFVEGKFVRVLKILGEKIKGCRGHLGKISSGEGNFVKVF
jgi:hypothetical protein